MHKIQRAITRKRHEQSPQEATGCSIIPPTSSLWPKRGDSSLTTRTGKLSRHAIIWKTGVFEFGTNEHKCNRLGNFTFAVIVNTWLTIKRRHEGSARDMKKLQQLVSR